MLQQGSMRTEDAACGGGLSLALCVLASGSRGNCSALRAGEGDAARVVLIDAGLAPRRAEAALLGVGVRMEQVVGIVYTHLDQDHAHPGWVSALPAGGRVFVHRAHRGRAHRAGLTVRRTELFEERFDLSCVGMDGVAGVSELGLHDSLGVAAFRFEAGGRPALGFATDVGRVSERLLGLLRGCPTVAMESNYCPQMQAASARPLFLKRRITGGAGHLSNRECAEAARALAPDHLALLHLSEECNTPEAALREHRGAAYGVTVTSQREPTGWIPLRPRRAPEAADGPGPRPVACAGAVQGLLFSC